MGTTVDIRQGLNPEQEKRARPAGEHSWYASQNGKSIQATSEDEGGTHPSVSVALGNQYQMRVYHRELKITSLTKELARKQREEAGETEPEQLSLTEECAKEDPPIRESKDITTFSKKSRRRAFEKLNKIQTACLSEGLFISLTYGHNELDADQLQNKFFKKFLPRLKEIIPDSCNLWRMEAHKSGKPHFHLMMWSYRKQFKIDSEYYHRQIRALWRDAIDQHDRAAQLYSCDIEVMNTFNKLRSYVSKYIAKEPEGQPLEVTGRRWGASANLPCAPITETGITGEEFRLIQNIVKTLLNNRGTNKKVIDWLMGKEDELSIWVDEDEMKTILSALNKGSPKYHYRNYIETGSIRPPDDYLSKMAAKVGCTY